MVWEAMNKIASSEKDNMIPQLPKIEAGAALRACFNAASSVSRLLFLVSPTCDICVSGALSAAQAVLSLPRECDFRLYLLWLPVLENDSIAAAAQTRARFPVDDRAEHFWDDNLQVSQTYHWTLQLGERQRRHRVAWDIFLLYRAGVRWEEAPPAPDFWMHQLFLEDVPKLDVDTLKYELEQTLRGA